MIFASVDACVAGASGKRFYAVALHQPSPLDAQAAAPDQAAQSGAKAGAPAGSFEAPAGFVLKGLALLCLP